MAISSDFFTIEGTLQAVRVAAGKINLLEDMQNGALFTGAAAGLVGQAGVLANQASLAMYDGEDVEHMACLINGKLAVGTFEWLGDVHVDDDVKLVVSEIEDGPLYIHAILRKRDQLLWLPYSINHTRLGWVMHSVKLGALLLFGSCLISMFVIAASGDSVFGQPLGIIFLVCFVIIALVMTLSTRDVLHLGQDAEDIFNALNIPRYRHFRIKQFSVKRLHYYDHEYPDLDKKACIYQFEDALTAHKERFNFS